VKKNHTIYPGPISKINRTRKLSIWLRARTPLEADTLGDYWIDTEHLLLGTLAEKNSLAARQLAKAGITFGSAQRTVVANKSSRPEYGRVPMRWAARSAVELWMLKWMVRIKSVTRSG
jgi:hypothetical protein